MWSVRTRVAYTSRPGFAHTHVTPVWLCTLTTGKTSKKKSLPSIKQGLMFAECWANAVYIMPVFSRHWARNRFDIRLIIHFLTTFLTTSFNRSPFPSCVRLWEALSLPANTSRSAMLSSQILPGAIICSVCFHIFLEGGGGEAALLRRTL